MKKLSIYIIIMAGLAMTGCLKDHSNVDFNSSGFIAEISHASITGNNAPSSGLDYFGAATLPVFSSNDPDTVTFDVNIASDYPPTKDITVTVAIDDAKRLAYNPTSSVIYDAQPDSTFSLPTTTMVIKAGTRIAKFMVIYYPAKIDPTKSYMLPITLTNASGIPISGNLSTIYFHIIGNLIAGHYQWDFTRWNNPDGTGSPSSLSFTGHTTSFVPDDPTHVEVASGYFIQPRYVIGFTNNNGVLSDFTVSFNPSDLAALIADGITVTSGPNIVKADPVTGEYIFQYTTASRYIIDRYYK